MVAPVLIFAIGNESRGDDALGPLLLRKLDLWLAEHGLSGQVELLEEFQLQVEHAMDMQGRRTVLFIDAGMDSTAPFAFYPAQTNDIPVLYSHALAPEALLKVYAQFYQESPPDVFILCIRGESFELGAGLSAQAKICLEASLEFCKRLLREPRPDVWHALCLRPSAKQVLLRENDLVGQAGHDTFR
jgi:hydrogenase maturation protease